MCAGGSWVLGAPDSPPASGRLCRVRLCALSLLLVLSGVCTCTWSDSSCLTGRCTCVCVPVHVRVWYVFLALNQPWAQRLRPDFGPPPPIFHMRLPVINHEYVLATDTTSQKSGLQVLNLTV